VTRSAGDAARAWLMVIFTPSLGWYSSMKAYITCGW